MSESNVSRFLRLQVTACNMLCCYAEELREGFLPYVQQVTDIMVPLLKFWFHEEVREWRQGGGGRGRREELMREVKETLDGEGGGGRPPVHGSQCSLQSVPIRPAPNLFNPV